MSGGARVRASADQPLTSGPRQGGLLTFDLREKPAVDAQGVWKRRALMFGFYSFCAAFLLYQVWFGFRVGLGAFTLASVAILGVPAVLFVVLVRGRVDPTELRVGPDGLGFEFERGPPFRLSWDDPSLRLRVVPAARGYGSQVDAERPWSVLFGWRGVTVTTAAKDAIVDSALAHPLVTVLTGEEHRGAPSTRRWTIRHRRAGDSALGTEVVP